MNPDKKYTKRIYRLPPGHIPDELRKIVGSVENLLSAAFLGDKEVVEQSLSAGADVNGTDENGYSALMLAVLNQHIELVKFLVAKGADVNARAKDLSTPLIRAVSVGQIEIARVLLEKGAKVDMESKNGWTPLMAASLRGDVEMVRFLLDLGAKMDLKDKETGKTALQFAARANHSEVVKALLERGAGVDLQNDEGLTALMLAAYEGHTKIVKMLIEKGADIYVENKQRFIAINFAQANDHIESAVALALKAHEQIDAILPDVPKGNWFKGLAAQMKAMTVMYELICLNCGSQIHLYPLTELKEFLDTEFGATLFSVCPKCDDYVKPDFPGNFRPVSPRHVRGNR